MCSEKPSKGFGPNGDVTWLPRVSVWPRWEEGVLSEAGALYRLAWKCRDGRKMVDYFGGSARKISKSTRCGM